MPSGGGHRRSAATSSEATEANRTQNLSRTLLLGLGNDIMTDDAIGLRIVRSARARLAGRQDIVIAESVEVGLALLDLVVGFEQLVVVDAIQSDGVTPGFLREIKPGELPLTASRSPHFVGLAEILALGRELGLAVPKTVKILAVQVLDPYTVGTRMTPELEAALPGAVEQVVRFLI